MRITEKQACFPIFILKNPRAMFLTILLFFSHLSSAGIDLFSSILAHDQSSEPKENTLDKISDDSFELMEKLCDQTVAKIHDESLEDEEDLLDGIDIPNFNDTLEEVEFILEMGNKLKAYPKKKLNCAASASNDISSIRLSDTREATPGSQPPLKRLKLSVGPVMLASTPNAGKPFSPNLLNFTTPEVKYVSCRSMINQVC